MGFVANSCSSYCILTFTAYCILSYILFWFNLLLRRHFGNRHRVSSTSTTLKRARIRSLFLSSRIVFYTFVVVFIFFISHSHSLNSLSQSHFSTKSTTLHCNCCCCTLPYNLPANSVFFTFTIQYLKVSICAI